MKKVKTAEEEFRQKLDFLVFVTALTLIMLALTVVFPACADECPKKYVASILSCDASGCVVLLLDGTKGKAKFPVKYAEVSEVCPL